MRDLPFAPDLQQCVLVEGQLPCLLDHEPVLFGLFGGVLDPVGMVDPMGIPTICVALVRSVDETRGRVLFPTSDVSSERRGTRFPIRSRNTQKAVQSDAEAGRM